MICQKCHVEYDESKKFCRNCGSPLSATEKPSSGNGSDPSLVVRMRIVRICPECHLHFEVGNYCRRCGSFLKKENVSQDRERTQEKRLVKSLSSEWIKLTKKKSEFEMGLGNLEGQRDAFSEDTFNPIFQRYQVQVESLSSRLREIEAELNSIRTKASARISLLEEESGMIQKRFQEIRSLHQLGAITRTDYFTEKNGMKKEMKSLERRLKEYRTTISLLSSPLGKGSVSPLKAGNLLQYRFPVIADGTIILIVLAAYFLWTNNVKLFHSQGSINASQTKPSIQLRLPVSSPGGPENEKIKSLFGTIRQANLEKKIELFMSCYAADFKDRNGKRLETLETWGHFDYLDLSYDLKKLTVTAQTAQVRVEWRINLHPKNGGTPQKTASLLDVNLKKEGSHWKIGEIKPVS
jgi:hypothetical protein